MSRLANILQQEYKKKTNYVISPEKIKEKNRKAYLKRKEKLQQLTDL